MKSCADCHSSRRRYFFSLYRSVVAASSLDAHLWRFETYWHAKCFSPAVLEFTVITAMALSPPRHWFSRQVFRFSGGLLVKYSFACLIAEEILRLHHYYIIAADFTAFSAARHFSQSAFRNGRHDDFTMFYRHARYALALKHMPLYTALTEYRR